MWVPTLRAGSCGLGREGSRIATGSGAGWRPWTVLPEQQLQEGPEPLHQRAEAHGGRLERQTVSFFNSTQSVHTGAGRGATDRAVDVDGTGVPLPGHHTSFLSNFNNDLVTITNSNTGCSTSECERTLHGHHG